VSEWTHQTVRGYLRFIRHIKRWKFKWNKFVLLPYKILGNLIIDSTVRFYVPVRCDGEGKVLISKGTKLGARIALSIGNGSILLQARYPKSKIRIGENCLFSNNVSVVAVESVEIGDYCLIGDMVTIIDSDFHGIDPDKRISDFVLTLPIKIENNVWLGSRVIIQKGVTIGANSIVTPNAVVTSSIPPNSIAGGVPARVIRSI